MVDLEGSENLRLLVYQVHSNLLHCKKRLADFPGQGEFGKWRPVWGRENANFFYIVRRFPQVDCLDDSGLINFEDRNINVESSKHWGDFLLGFETKMLTWVLNNIY